jgi:hypothetical protein
MFTKEQQDRAIEAAHFQQESARGLEQIFSAYPTLVRCDANKKLIQEYCREFMGDEVAVSLDTFRNFLDLNPGAWKSLVHRDVEVTKQQIIEDILTLLASKNQGRDGRFDSFNLRSEAKRMESWSVDALRARLAEIRSKQSLASKSTSELKQIVSDARRPTPQATVLPVT